MHFQIFSSKLSLCMFEIFYALFICLLYVGYFHLFSITKAKKNQYQQRLFRGSLNVISLLIYCWLNDNLRRGIASTPVLYISILSYNNHYYSKWIYSVLHIYLLKTVSWNILCYDVFWNNSIVYSGWALVTYNFRLLYRYCLFCISLTNLAS